LYSQGFSLARYLIDQGGKGKFLAFVGAGMENENWSQALRKFYGYEDLHVLQNSWLDWVRAGSPQLASTPDAEPTGSLVADAASLLPRPQLNLGYRGQSPDGAAPSRRGLVPVTRCAAAESHPLPVYPGTARPSPSPISWRPGGTRDV